MPKYQGHKNWNHWNVSLWINNDEGLYRMALDNIQWRPKQRNKAAQAMLDQLADCGMTHTPDGAPYSVSSIRTAMVGM